jgi:hypothetical protein
MRRAARSRISLTEPLLGFLVVLVAEERLAVVELAAAAAAVSLFEGP